jgi:SAM-dependent methyltransferase
MSEERRASPVAVDGSANEVASAPRDPSAARRRLTLRIPDDEVARPQSQAPEALSRPETPAAASSPVGAALTPMRIITISEPPAEAPVGYGDGSETAENLSIDLPEPLTPRVLALEVEEEEEVDVRFEDDPPTPRVDVVMIEASPDVPPAAFVPPADAAVSLAVAAPAVRVVDAADEVAAEDVVTLEPPPARPAMSVVPPMRSRLASQPPVPPPAPSKRPAVTVAPLPPRPALVIVPPQLGNMSAPQPEGPGPKRKPRLWWEDLFNDDYLRTVEKITDAQIVREVSFIEESLSVERGGALLDLACGTGRHAIDLARRGYEVVAFDLSLAMLARAGEDAQDRATKLNFVQGDMREMSFDEQFDGVYCWNTSFGYFDEEKNAQVVDRVHRSLKAGGQFLLDVVNRDFLIRQSPSLAWFEGDGCVCMDEMSVDFITSRMKVKRTMMLDDGRSREIEYSMRVYSLHELGRILHEHGFKVREVSGRPATPGVFFGNESPRAIILAEKR